MQSLPLQRKLAYVPWSQILKCELGVGLGPAAGSTVRGWWLIPAAQWLLLLAVLLAVLAVAESAEGWHIHTAVQT